MLTVLLPAYNEARAIGALIKRIEEALVETPYCIVVVNDGSMDGTDEIVKRAPRQDLITLLDHPENLGLGRAMKTGIDHVCSHGDPDDFVVSMDADNTHDPSLILDMIQAANNGADIVIASRFVQQAGQIGVPWYRRILSGGARMVFQLLFPLDASDYTCGYRLYRLGLLQKANRIYTPLIEAEGFVVMVEILLKLSRLHPVVTEVPLMLRYDFKEGQSKLKLVKTLLEYGRILLRLWGRKPVIPD